MYKNTYVCNLLKQREVNSYVDCMIKFNSKYDFCCIKIFLNLSFCVLLIVFSNIHNCFITSFIVSLNCILFQWIEVCFKFNNCFTDLLNVSFNSNIVHPELKFVSMKRLLCQNSNNCCKQIEDCLKAIVKRCSTFDIKSTAPSKQKFAGRIINYYYYKRGLIGVFSNY